MGKKSLRINENISDNIETSTEIIKPLDESVDRINNLGQKERNLAKAGVTRFKYLSVIADALTAEKMGDVFDAQGNVTRQMVPDVSRRQWGAEQAAKLFGDMIERKEIEHDIGDKTLERFKRMSVQQLQERAREILKGNVAPHQLSHASSPETIDVNPEPVTTEEY